MLRSRPIAKDPATGHDVENPHPNNASKYSKTYLTAVLENRQLQVIALLVFGVTMTYPAKPPSERTSETRHQKRAASEHAPSPGSCVAPSPSDLDGNPHDLVGAKAA
jgi:hypothetical protein